MLMSFSPLMRIRNAKEPKTYKVEVWLKVINNTVDWVKPGLASQ